jgi:hypothetical protein
VLLSIKIKRLHLNKRIFKNLNNFILIICLTVHIRLKLLKLISTCFALSYFFNATTKNVKIKCHEKCCYITLLLDSTRLDTLTKESPVKIAAASIY